MHILVVHVMIALNLVSLLFQSNTQDQIIIWWESGVSATMYILLVHAMFIYISSLYCFSPTPRTRLLYGGSQEYPPQCIYL